MKRLIVMYASILLFVPFVSSAQTISQLQSEIQHLKARIADCQNEIYEANNNIWQLNFEITNLRSEFDWAGLKYQDQVNDLLDSLGGNTLCFEEDSTQYAQSDTLNQQQQVDSLLP